MHVCINYVDTFVAMHMHAVSLCECKFCRAFSNQKVWAREGGRECRDCDSYCRIAFKDKLTRQKQKEELAKELEDDEQQAHWVQGPYKEFCNDKKEMSQSSFFIDRYPFLSVHVSILRVCVSLIKVCIQCMHMHVAVRFWRPSLALIVAIALVASAHVFCQCTRSLPVRTCSRFSLGTPIKDNSIEDLSALAFLQRKAKSALVFCFKGRRRRFPKSLSMHVSISRVCVSLIRVCIQRMHMHAAFRFRSPSQAKLKKFERDARCHRVLMTQGCSCVS